jgi:hypothetical protein
MKSDPKKLPLWLAVQLERPGRAFEKMVFRGGSKKGVKEEFGGVPPIRINSLKTAIATQLASSTTATLALREPEALLELLDNYWSAVKESFPEAWADRKGHILLQTIGFMGFAKFGGHLIDRALKEDRLEKADFKSYLEPVKAVSLARDEYKGIAGAGGVAIIADKLTEACEELAVLGAHAKKRLLGKGASNEEKLKNAESKK